MNTVRKIALNCIKAYKQKSGSRFPLSKIMFSCLMDRRKLLPVLCCQGKLISVAQHKRHLTW